MWNWDFAFEIFPQLLKAVWVTLSATVIGFMIALIIGLFWAIARRSRFKVVSLTVKGVVEFIRCTPLLEQFFFIFYVLPSYGVTLSPFTAGVIGLGLHYSTYISEVYRSGIESISRGQWEASIALNFSKVRTWISIILPQAIPPVLPMFGNYFIVLFKETPLLSAITVVELMSTAKMIGSESFRYLEPFTIVGLLFFLMGYPGSLLVKYLDAKLNHKISKRFVK
jgi:polar amino acid transport system permease protein